MNILIVNVNWLGDTIFAGPLIKAIRQHYPDSYLAIFTHPRCREVLEGNPYIDEIIIYDKNRHRGLIGKFSLISQLRAKRFDMVFMLRRSLSRAMLLFFSKIPERIGYDNKKSGFLLTKKIAPPGKDIHRVEYFLGLARGIGIEPEDTRYQFFLTDRDRDEARSLLKKEGIENDEEFIVLNPGGNWELKRWSEENFALLIDEISSAFKIKVVLTGSERDIELCRRIGNLSSHKPILLCGKTSLKVLAGVFEKARKVVSNDSGPMHIAAGVGAEVVALFGPTSPEITGPYGKGKATILRKDVGCKIPCYNLRCKDNRCMKAIKVKDVFKVLR